MKKNYLVLIIAFVLSMIYFSKFVFSAGNQIATVTTIVIPAQTSVVSESTFTITATQILSCTSNGTNIISYTVPVSKTLNGTITMSGILTP